MQKSVRTMWIWCGNARQYNQECGPSKRPSFKQRYFAHFLSAWPTLQLGGVECQDLQQHSVLVVSLDYNHRQNWSQKKINDPSSAQIMPCDEQYSKIFRRYNVSGAEAPQLWPLDVRAIAVAIPTMGSVVSSTFLLFRLQCSFLDSMGEWQIFWCRLYCMQMAALSCHLKPLTIGTNIPVRRGKPDMLT